MSDYDPTDVRGQEREREQAQTQIRLAEETEDSDLKWLMGSRRGRRVVWRILDRAGVFRLSFSTDPLAMAFAEGSRNSGLRMLAQLHELCPKRYMAMVREQASDNRNSDD